jgi:hypothetical protein
MIRFCHLAPMTMEQKDPELSRLPTHLTRFGTLMTLTCSFLYSLFDKRDDSTNLLRIWNGFDHPFYQKLAAITEQLEPFRDDLFKVRSHYDFHGSLSRAHEVEGFEIFQESKVRPLFEAVHEMKQLAVEMIVWHTVRSPDPSVLSDLRVELLGET